MFVPSLTDEAGSVLTVADWLSVDVTLAACELEALLLKPGLAVLQQLDNLKAYWDWPGELVLNALLIANHAKEQCVIRSKYDGQILRFTYDEILVLIQHLNPEHVALPAYLLPLAKQAYPDIYSKCVAYDLEHANKPGQDALQGLIYASGDEREYFITDIKYAMDFSVLDKACTCPACSDGFTRAYFHHLYVHTPLLCQRWLVMHNIWMAHYA
ncbi:MAG: hypothetical protein P1U39_04605 [Legionellaceae bacterium]|nr:hypothetical protein [Legionellaceae bacterium]